MARLVSPTGRDRTIRAARPNVGLERRYRRALDALIDAMGASIERWVIAQWRKTPPRIAVLAEDAPADDIARLMRLLSRRWLHNFDEASPALGRFFANRNWRAHDAQLRAILKKAGIAVRFQMTPAMRDAIEATMQAQVALIRSIPEEHLRAVEGIVMRGVQRGADVGQIREQLQRRLHISKQRATTIAQHQNSMATATFTRARQLELGIDRAIWMHSRITAKGHFRPTHLKNDGKTYDVNRGWLDPAVGERIFPGQLINCRCVSRSVIPGA